MLLIPLRGCANPRGDDGLIIILDKTSIARMEKDDPFQLETDSLGLTNPMIMVCLENDSATINRLAHAKDINGLIKHLTRGFEYRPDLGDRDDGPQPLQAQN
jgi:hypothetical protein